MHQHSGWMNKKCRCSDSVAGFFKGVAPQCLSPRHMMQYPGFILHYAVLIKCTSAAITKRFGIQPIIFSVFIISTLHPERETCFSFHLKTRSICKSPQIGLLAVGALSRTAWRRSRRCRKNRLKAAAREQLHRAKTRPGDRDFLSGDVFSIRRPCVSYLGCFWEMGHLRMMGCLS